MKLGRSEYLMWQYLKTRNFRKPTIDEMTRHFGRHSRTIKAWLKKLEEHGYI